MINWLRKYTLWIGILCLIISFISLLIGVCTTYGNSFFGGFLAAAGFIFFFTTGVFNLVMGEDFYD